MADQLTSVTCNHCGAPLQVPETTRFITCSYCGTPLEVHRSGNAIYTEVLAAIDQRTQQMAQDLNVIKRQNQVEQLDREWQMRRDSLLIRGEHGSVSEPSAAGGIIGCVVAVVMGIVWMVGTSSAGAPGGFVLFGLIFIAAGVFGGITSVGRAAQYNDAQQDYQRRRDAILHDTSSTPGQRPPA